MTVDGRYPIGGSETAVPKHRGAEAPHRVIGNALVVVKIANGDLRRGYQRLIGRLREKRRSEARAGGKDVQKGAS